MFLIRKTLHTAIDKTCVTDCHPFHWVSPFPFQSFPFQFSPTCNWAISLCLWVWFPIRQAFGWIPKAILVLDLSVLSQKEISWELKMKQNYNVCICLVHLVADRTRACYHEVMSVRSNVYSTVSVIYWHTIVVWKCVQEMISSGWTPCIEELVFANVMK